MTRDEMRKKMLEILLSFYHGPRDCDRAIDLIIALFEGWKSPEEMKEATFDNMRFFCSICKYNPEKEVKDDKR
jgi:hypothetical protein